MSTRTWKPSRRLVATRTGAAALLLSGASLLGLAVFSAGAATAAAGSVTSVDPSTNKALSGPQPATTVFSANLPSQAACPGDTASNAFHVYSFLVPIGTDPASISFATNGPSVGNGGYFDNSGYQGPFNTAVKTGQVVGLPNDLQWSTYPGPASDLTGTSSKTWDAGWACADGKGVVQRYWDQQVTFATAGSGFTWTVAAAAAGTTTSSSSSSSSSTSSTSSSTSTSTSTSTTSTTADTTTTLDPSGTTTTVDPNSTATLADGPSGSTSTTVCVAATTSTTQAARTTTTIAGATTTAVSARATPSTTVPASTSGTVTAAAANGSCPSSGSGTSSTLGGAAAVKGDLFGGGTASSPAASGSSAAQSTLPFTGLPGDKAVGLGIFLIGAGLALVVAAHRRQELERMMWPDQV